MKQRWIWSFADIFHTVATLDNVESVNSVDNVSSVNTVHNVHNANDEAAARSAGRGVIVGSVRIQVGAPR